MDVGVVGVRDSGAVRDRVGHEVLLGVRARPLLIGLTGRAGSGKSLCASHLGRLGFQRVKFAGAIRRMLGAIGLSPSDLEEWKGEPHPLLMGQTPRYAMQTLGTEWGRNAMGGIWVGIAMSDARRWMLAGDSVVIDDLRFPDEAEAVKADGGIVLRVARPMSLLGLSHESEAHVDAMPVDGEVVNDGTPAVLLSRLMAAIEEAT